jgi:hypothetical protein
MMASSDTLAAAPGIDIEPRILRGNGIDARGNLENVTGQASDFRVG